MKNNSNWVPLTPEAHGHMKISSGSSASYFADSQLIPVTVREIAKVGADCPIVFVKNPETGQLELVALAGVSPGQNVFIDRGRWVGISHPQVFYVRPLSMQKTAKDEQYVLCVDEVSQDFSAHAGESLFEANGSPTPILSQRIEQALQFADSHAQNQTYVDTLVKLGLLKERTIEISQAGADATSLSGIYLIDDDRFRDLSESNLLALKGKGVLTAIYAQMLSMQQLPRIVKLAMAKAE